MLRRQCVVQLKCLPRIILHGCRYSTTSNTKHELVTVPCKNNGSFTIEIYRPSSSTTEPADHQLVNDSILLYLPRGSIFKPKNSNGSSQHATASLASNAEIGTSLANASSATVVQINYRVSPQHRFPTAIHDVVLGYDWAVKHLASRETPISDNTSTNQNGGSNFDDCQSSSQLQKKKNSLQTQVGVCGELLGGSLALSLALSECRLPVFSDIGGLENPGRVVAAAVNSPIVDWIFQPPSDPTLKRKSSRRKQSPIAEIETELPPSPNPSISTPSLPDLLLARKALFHPTRAGDWFDPFASPVLFLRTPGIEVATAKAAFSPPPSADDTDTPPPSFEDLDPPSSGPPIPSPSYAELAADDTVDLPTPPLPTPPPTPTHIPAVKPYKPRRLPRKYPPTPMLPAVFPAFRISVPTHGDAVLREQSAEMVALLRRALGRFTFPGAKSGEDGDAQGEAQEAYVRERVEILEGGKGEGKGAWDVQEAERVGMWFRGVFSRRE